MFNLLGIGERAGSGFDAMRQGCRWARIPDPELVETLAPNRTTLVIRTGAEESAVASNRREEVSYAYVDPFPNGRVVLLDGSSREDTALSLMEAMGSVARRDVETLLEVSPATAKKLLAGLVERGMVRVVGSGRSTRYERRERSLNAGEAQA